MRLHDVGMEELLLLIPLTVAAFALRNRFARGMLAGWIALAYVAIRFPLELLRLRDLEPLRLGLTGGQWGCLAVSLVAVLLLALIRRATPS